MTTYNTGNPIGSKDPRDLYDNAQALDEAVNSTGSGYTDRTGASRKTLKWMETAATGIPAVQAVLDAQSAKTAAEAARDAANVNAKIYATTSAGIAATTNGQYFSVPASASSEYLILYLNNGGTAVEQKRYPSTAPVAALTARLTSDTGTNALLAFTDSDGNTVISVGADGGVRLTGDETSVQSHIETLNNSVGANDGTDAFIVLADNDGKTIASFDKNLELKLSGAPRSLQTGMASNYLFTAMRYAQANDSVNASYWYDRAENEFVRQIRMDAVIAATGTDSAIQRIPAITKVSEGRLLYIWQQIHRPGSGDGNGVRLMQCFVDYDLTSNTISVGERSVFEQPAGWTSNLGANMHPHLITLPDGKIICVFCQQDAPSGLIADDDRNTYMKTSTDGGVTWSAKVKILSAPGSVPRYITPGTTGDFVRITSGPYAGRLIFPVYTSDANNNYAVYSDDNGATWTQTALVATPGYDSNEPGIALRSDGSLIMNFRTESTFNLPYSISTDGGVTWTFQGARSDWRSSNCASSMAQAAEGPPDGFKKLLWSGLDNSGYYAREGLVLRVSHDGGVTYTTQYRPIEEKARAGYSNVRMIAPNVFAVAWEQGFNDSCSAMIYIANLSEVYRNGTHS